MLIFYEDYKVFLDDFKVEKLAFGTKSQKTAV